MSKGPKIFLYNLYLLLSLRLVTTFTMLKTDTFIYIYYFFLVHTAGLEQFKSGTSYCCIQLPLGDFQLMMVVENPERLPAAIYARGYWVN